MLSSLAWIRKGAAQSIPRKFELSEEDARNFLEESNAFLEANRTGLKGAQQKLDLAPDTESEYEEEEDDMDASDEEAEMETSANDIVVDEMRYAGLGEEEIIRQKYDMDSYDKKSKKERKQSRTAVDDTEMDYLFSNIKSLTVGDISKDEYLVNKGEDLEEDEERDDVIIRDSDFLIVAARTEEELSQLEVYVYEEEADNLYVHHDIMLPSYPLCLEWLNHSFSKSPEEAQGNFVAVGTFDPEIEIWNLDLLDPVYPAMVLGAKSTSATLKRSKSDTSKSSKATADRHMDAVMCLSWNKLNRNILLSGSADKTIKLWDLQSPEVAVRSFDPHHEKIQTIEWSISDARLFLSGGFDKRAALVDIRTPKEATYFKLKGDAEVVRWNPFQSHQFAVSDETGLVHLVDTRSLSSGEPYSSTEKQRKSLFSLEAHTKAVSCIDWNPFVPNILLTSSIDKTATIWDFGQASNQPVSLISKNFGLGKIFAGSFCRDSPFLVSLAGSKGKLHIWKLYSLAESSELLRSTMQERLRSLASTST